MGSSITNKAGITSLSPSRRRSTGAGGRSVADGVVETRRRPVWQRCLDRLRRADSRRQSVRLHLGAITWARPTISSSTLSRAGCRTSPSTGGATAGRRRAARGARKVKEEHGEPPQIIVHSMGCNFVLAALHAAELIHSTILCGGTFGGCIATTWCSAACQPAQHGHQFADGRYMGTRLSGSPARDLLLDAGDGKRHMELSTRRCWEQESSDRSAGLATSPTGKPPARPWMGGATCRPR